MEFIVIPSSMIGERDDKWKGFERPWKAVIVVGPQADDDDEGQYTQDEDDQW